MVNAAAQYRRALKKKLRCSKEVKNRLLEGFDKTVATYLEENTAPSIDDLISAFGPAEEMADTLMKEVTPQEQTQYRRFTLFKQILTLIFAIVFAISTAYLWFYKEVGLTSTNDVGIIDEYTDPTSNFNSGDDIT